VCVAAAVGRARYVRMSSRGGVGERSRTPADRRAGAAQARQASVLARLPVVERAQRVWVSSRTCLWRAHTEAGEEVHLPGYRRAEDGGGLSATSRRTVSTA
jgi:hypothetical protein